jgi:hypothetical protein
LGTSDCGAAEATGATGTATTGAGDGAGFGTAVGGATAAASFSAMTALANSVASTPQTGHFTGAAMRPLTGSVSNRNFAPQLQKTLTSMFNVSVWD